jgi:hypothetical protein
MIVLIVSEEINKRTKRVHGVFIIRRRKCERSLLPSLFTNVFVDGLTGYSSNNLISHATPMMMAIDRRSAVLSGSKDLAEKTLKKSGVRARAKSQAASIIALQALASLVCTD